MPIRPERSQAWGPLLVLLACAQATAPALPELTGVGVPIGGDRSGVPDPPFVPMGYAFAIWGPIFLGCLLISLAFFTRAWRRDRALHSLAPWFALAMLACTLWSIVASYADLVLGTGWWGLTIPNFLLILAPLALGLIAWSRELARTGGPGTSRGAWLVGGTLGLYTGWCTAAIFANIAAWLASPPALNFGGSEGGISLALLLCAGGVAHALLWHGAKLVRAASLAPLALMAFVGAIVWALVAIGVKNVPAQPTLERTLGVLAFVLAASLVLAAVLRLRGLLATQRSMPMRSRTAALQV